MSDVLLQRVVRTPAALHGAAAAVAEVEFPKRRADLEVVVRRLRKDRSLEQLGWYRAVILPIVALAEGEVSHEVMHEKLLWAFAPRWVGRDLDGNLVEIPKRTSGGHELTMSTFEKAGYCEAIRTWASIHHGINIPDPDPARASTRRRARAPRGSARAS